MAKQDITITATDGYELGASVFLPGPGQPAKRTVIINSATAVLRRYYDAYATYLADRGLAVITYDYRGIGDSLRGDIRQLSATMADWGLRDYAGVLAYAAQALPSERTSVVGHSAGGWLLGLLGEQPRVSSILTVCSQSGYWKWWEGKRRYFMAALWYGLMPSVSRVVGYYPAKRFGLGEDLPGGVAEQWAYWGRHADYMIDDTGKPMREGFSSLAVPLRSYSFSDDTMAPQAAVENIHALYVRASVDRQHLRPSDIGAKQVGHFGFFKKAHQQTLWADSVSWIEAH